MFSHLAHQFRERSSSLTQHQPQQHDHEVLVLGLAELFAKSLGKLVHLIIQT
jgi:hypothetical protein